MVRPAERELEHAGVSVDHRRAPVDPVRHLLHARDDPGLEVAEHRLVTGGTRNGSLRKRPPLATNRSLLRRRARSSFGVARKTSRQARFSCRTLPNPAANAMSASSRPRTARRPDGVASRPRNRFYRRGPQRGRVPTPCLDTLPTRCGRRSRAPPDRLRRSGDLMAKLVKTKESKRPVEGTKLHPVKLEKSKRKAPDGCRWSLSSERASWRSGECGYAGRS